MKSFSSTIVTEKKMQALGAALAKFTVDGTVIFLYGSLGAGKTTLVRGFLRQLGYVDKVKSPTYTLVEPYEFGERMVFHFDLYRLQHADELKHIGLEEYFSPHSICLIEWPEKAKLLLPVADLACYISFTDTGREVRLEALTQVGEDILLNNYKI